MTTEPTEPKQRKAGTGRFEKGTSGNPTGRPHGSRNRSTVLMQALLDGESESLTRKAIERGLDGDPYALRICMARLLAPLRDRPIELSLAPIENIQQIPAAMSTVLEAVGKGIITPSEGEKVTQMLERQLNVLTIADLECRMEQAEQLVQAGATDKQEQVDQEAADLVQRLNEGRSPQAVGP